MTGSYAYVTTIQQAFFKATRVTKDFSKCHLTFDVHFLEQYPFPGIVSNWQSHNSHKGVLKMPHVVVVVSIS